nr:Chain 31, LR9 [Porphyridium purpureum]6KGX_34 Chain 34, LR9 [Porphyridium purpureum]7EZX_k6 Chain k6, FAS1 domain-containing protein [Porphyridium purpureum]7EZX_kH Chain kH, FAS1 domain-containing protein [Porphyridium purpureum]7Y4L_fA Chain fA, FAS1 domain-containing protein [Porphyridium purpureum]7Y4L_hA Chain hA, FAS1 domain-containing protein [Porphyridium purpureum]7Y5E_fB Chain fB, FAS1 domain-containing protein [Porphyridium purpureum]7Y5E_hB Chain hB, FAS1 domain-containing pro
MAAKPYESGYIAEDDFWRGRGIAAWVYATGANKVIAQIVKDFNLTDKKFMVFIPNDGAFARLSPQLRKAMMEDSRLVYDMLAGHIFTSKGSAMLKDLQGAGYLQPAYGEAIGYVGTGRVIKIGNAQVIPESSDILRKNLGFSAHTLDTFIVPKALTKKVSIEAGFSPVTPAKYVSTTKADLRYVGATKPAAVGGRRAMNLMKQQPFWMYGPPYNAVTQDEYEPISAAAPKAFVDYQIFAPGTVKVSPDSVNANELNPVSGMSKYIGKTQKLVGDQGISDRSDKLPMGQ